MRRANVVSGVVLAMFGLLMLFVIVPWQIEPGPDGMLSPSLMPNLMLILITGLAVLLAINSLRERAAETDEAPPISGAELVAMFKIGAIFALALVLYLWVSPLAAGAALIVGALVVLGERRPLVIVAMPAGLLLALWFLFYKVLGTAIV